MWIAHLLANPTSLTSSNGFHRPNAVNLVSMCHKLAAQLIRFAPCLHLSDPVAVVEFNHAHRHMCSSTMINRAFDLVHFVPPVERDSPLCENPMTRSDRTHTQVGGPQVAF